MTDIAREKVYVLLHRDSAVALVLGVYADLQDANAGCIRHAEAAGVPLSSQSSTTGPDNEHMSPVEPVRWDTPEGVSCWVEEHSVVPKKVVFSAASGS